MILSAQYALPHHISVELDALDCRYDTYIGPVRATVVTPPRVGPSDLTIPPTLAGVPEEAWAVEPGSEIPQWSTTYPSFGTDDATGLRRIGLQLREEGRKVEGTLKHHGQHWTAKIADVTADNIERWFLQVENWVSVVTGDDVDHRQPVYDSNSIGPGLLTWRQDRWQNSGFRISTPTPTPLTREMLRAILERVGDGDQPPIEHQLWRDSRAALVRGDTRKAVLDAATAVEVCLIDLVDKTETATGEKLTGPKGLMNRSNWVASRVEDYTPHPELKQLADLRNKTIHAGEPATYDRRTLVCS
ncbi:hypothetical protein [Rhodococcus erythropolis]|uniref:hypothetical protein n=1 Tax=Rhodococcus erythropolis TaxID=1833 RepID=UPI003D12B7F3